MIAMQNPNITDWRLSPGSFTLSGAVMIGEDGCETLLPSNLSTHQFRFRQIARSDRKREDPGVTIRAGYVLEYTTEWFSVGHSLGQMVYSLPLAPGEVAKLAFVDWSRSDAATRREDTGFSESLIHDQLRDRTLTESVHAVLNEWQHGGSVMAGAAASVGSGLASGGLSGAGIGLTAALGGAYSTTSGTRDLAVDTAQHIADAFHQASTAVRELRSTVVVQSTQSETADLRTRVVANYNHSHALTLLYYEVLRHYRVVTRLASTRPALLLNSHPPFNAFSDPKDIIPYRQRLEAALLDGRLLSCFDAVEKLYAFTNDPPPKDPEPDKTKLVLFQLRFLTGGMTSMCLVTGFLRDRENNPATQVLLNSPDGTPGGTLAAPNEFEALNHTVNGQAVPFGGSVEWGKVGFAVFHFDSRQTNGQSHTGIRSVDVRGVDTAGVEHPLGHWDGDIVFDMATPEPNRLLLIPIARPPDPPPQPTPRMRLSDTERADVDKLMTHLQLNAQYYNRTLWLSEDPNIRAARFDSLTVAGVPVLNLIENRALEVLGDFVAFPVNVGEEIPAGLPFQLHFAQAAPTEDVFVEQLLTLPTRGVFGEAKLGHCNASEVIDNSRFWDWQKSPIPFAAPDITGVDAGSRAQPPTGLTPTPFPQSVVNIVTPGALPDPTGLAGALNVLGTPGIFRDQSGLQEVGALLEKLSDNATSLASTAMKDQARKEAIDTIRNAPELTAAQKKELIGEVITGQVQDTKPTSQPSTGGSTTTPPSGVTPATSAPSKDTGTTGSNTTPDPGGRMIPPPAPKPQSVKPQRPNPQPPGPGLTFQISFQIPVLHTTAQGSASVDVYPTGKPTVTPEGSDPGYIPGESIGPPRPGEILPAHYTDRPFRDGSLVLQTQNATAPGQIHITARYKLLIFEKNDVVALFAQEETAATRRNPQEKTFTYDNTRPYTQPKIGNIVMLDVTPTTVTVSISGEDAKSLEDDFGKKVASKAEIIEIEGHDGHKETSSGKQTRTYTMTLVTGGLDIIQTNPS
jgi:hypothetical protein